MRLEDSPEEAAWRAEVAEFIRREMPASVKVTPRLQGEDIGELPEVKGTPAPMTGGAGFRPHEGDFAVWREKLAAQGLDRAGLAEGVRRRRAHRRWSSSS